MKAKKIIIRIIGVIIGTMLLGLGVALFKLASLGQDGLSSFCFSLLYLINPEWNYNVYYFSVNFIFFILMLIFLRENINFGTIFSLCLTGVFCSLVMKLNDYFGIISHNLVDSIFIGLIGEVTICAGIALYAGADMGISPYDALPLIITKQHNWFPYRFARIIIDLLMTILGFVLGFIVLKRHDIFGIMTIVSIAFSGPLISLFGKLFNKLIYKNETSSLD